MKTLAVVLVIGILAAFAVPIIAEKDGVETAKPTIVVHKPKGIVDIEYDGVRYVIFKYNGRAFLLNKDSL